tara:strand:- start:608 stop:1207 length:600 start_codon:yes stop_codon:yes gene_type:complete
MQKKLGKITTNNNLKTSDAPPGQFVTEKFPVFSVFPTPSINLDTWKLTINADSNLIREYKWNEIIKLTEDNIEEDFHCVTQWSRLDTKWEGFLVNNLFKNFEIDSDLKYVNIICYDGYTTNILRTDLLSPQTILATKFEGKELEPNHGWPLRLVIPHLYGWKSAKWIKEIQFTSNPMPGFWEVRGYHMNGDPWKQERFS